MKCAAVICAAGAGSRMGQNKALCHIGSETFLSSIVRTLKNVTTKIDPIVVVTGAQDELVRLQHAALPVVWAHNALWQTTHMLESLACGLSLVPDDCDVIHWPVDCIGISSPDLARLLDLPEGQTGVIGVNGKPGHPVKFSADQMRELRQKTHGYQSLKDVFLSRSYTVIDASGPVMMNCNDPRALSDFVARMGKM